MKPYIFFAFILSSSVIAAKESSNPQAVSFELVSLEHGVATLKMSNISTGVLSYEHWFGQVGMPVAYCENARAEIYVCSTKIFLLEDDYYTHDTYINPGDSLLLEANVSKGQKVGVKFYSTGGKGNKYYWFSFNAGV